MTPGYAMSTRAIAILRKEKIPFEVLSYEHKEKGAAFAAQATGFALEQTVKTLVADLGPSGFVLVLVPGNRKLSMKRLAKACGVKRAAMADTASAERLTGYRVGGISPFGIRNPVPVVMEAEILKFEKILINAGRRGTMLVMNPVHVRKALGCKLASVIRQK